MSGLSECAARHEEYQRRIQSAMEMLAVTPEEIEDTVKGYPCSRGILLNCWNPEAYPCHVPHLLIGAYEFEKVVILSILAEYALRGEEGWIFTLGQKTVRGMRPKELSDLVSNFYICEEDRGVSGVLASLRGHYFWIPPSMEKEIKQDLQKICAQIYYAIHFDLGNDLSAPLQTALAYSIQPWKT